MWSIVVIKLEIARYISLLSTCFCVFVQKQCIPISQFTIVFLNFDPFYFMSKHLAKKTYVSMFTRLTRHENLHKYTARIKICTNMQIHLKFMFLEIFAVIIDNAWLHVSANFRLFRAIASCSEISVNWFVFLQFSNVWTFSKCSNSCQFELHHQKKPPVSQMFFMCTPKS